MLVLGVLEVVLFDISPELLNAFGTAGFFLADDVSELSTELHGFGKSGSLRHVDSLVFRRFDKKSANNTIRLMHII